MNKIKRNDTVIVLTGRDRGRSGKVIKLEGDRIVVEGISMIKKNVKPNPHTQTQGGIVDKESSIHISNVALLNPVSNKADKVVFKTVDGKKVRCFKSNNEVING